MPGQFDGGLGQKVDDWQENASMWSSKIKDLAPSGAFFSVNLDDYMKTVVEKYNKDIDSADSYFDDYDSQSINSASLSDDFKP